MASAADYHPFGLEMPGRTYNSAEYRYGFNGKEKDQDGEFGSITNYDYGFRIYNPAIARFLSVDPLTRGYLMLTPYQFASNSPISGIDLDGLEYLDADDAIINITSGGVFIKLENSSRFTRRASNLAQGYIDLENRIIDSSFPGRITEGGVDFSEILVEREIARDGMAGPRNSKESRARAMRTHPVTGQPVEITFKDKFSGNSKQRRAARRSMVRAGGNPGQPISFPSKIGKAGLAGVVVGATVIILDKFANASVSNDFGKAVGQLRNEGRQAIQLVINNLDIIPDKFLTESYLSELMNYTFQGELALTHENEITKELETIAQLLLLSEGELNCGDCLKIDKDSAAVREFFQKVNEREKINDEND